MTTITMETSGRARIELPSIGKAQTRIGRVLSGVAVLFLTMDAAMKVLSTAPAISATMQLGYPESMIVPLGIIEFACLVVYLVPRTSILGAILWTGFLGGAVASHARLQDPLFTHVLFPVYVALLLWGGLWLRDRHLRTLLPRS
jgi:hypothetical protein